MTTIAPPCRKKFLSLPEEWRRGTKSYDLLAAAPLMVWYGLSATSQFMALHKDFGGLGFAHAQFSLVADILSRLAIMLFALVLIGLLFARRPATASAAGIGPRVAGVLGTYLSVGILLLPTGNIAPWLRDVSTVIILGGMAFALYSLLWLGRSVSLVAEARKLVTGGPYTIVRHPLYLGEQLAVVGVVVQYLSAVNVVAGCALLIFALQVLCQIYRMSYEEQVLENQFPDYGAYKAHTFRILPGVY